MLFEEDKKQAIAFYNNLCKYEGKYYNETVTFMSFYFSIYRIGEKPNKEDIKRFVEFINRIKLKPFNDNSSLYVLLTYLMDVLKMQQKN